MIPIFPKFKKLELSDRQEVEKITSEHTHYSDFNFTSMYSWNIRDLIEISNLNGNLVVKFTDYVSDDIFFSFIGKNKINETADEIFNFIEKNKIGLNRLKLVPEVVAERLDRRRFVVREDMDNFDYILSTEKLKNYLGNSFASKRTHVRRFIKDKHNFSFEVFNTLDEDLKQQIKDTFFLWAIQKQIVPSDAENELMALSRFLYVHVGKNFFTSVVLINGIVRAFWSLELLGKDVVISHFEKANTLNYKGISQFLTQKTSEALHKKGVLEINLEQDLGIPGLRQSKESHEPIYYLKKFVVERI